MIKRYIGILVIGFFVWIFSTAIFYPFIVRLILKEGHPFLINHVYFFCLFIGMGLLMGWAGKSKGWLLGLILGITITAFSLSVSLIDSFFEVEIQKWGYAKTLIKLINSNILFTFYLVLGGFLGGRIKLKLNRPEGNRVDGKLRRKDKDLK
jgi:hypothetical protein